LLRKHAAPSGCTAGTVPAGRRMQYACPWTRRRARSTQEARRVASSGRNGTAAHRLSSSSEAGVHLASPRQLLLRRAALPRGLLRRKTRCLALRRGGGLSRRQAAAAAAEAALLCRCRRRPLHRVVVVRARAPGVPPAASRRRLRPGVVLPGGVRRGGAREAAAAATASAVRSRQWRQRRARERRARRGSDAPRRRGARRRVTHSVAPAAHKHTREGRERARVHLLCCGRQRSPQNDGLWAQLAALPVSRRPLPALRVGDQLTRIVRCA
jgi:hypothetical protein